MSPDCADASWNGEVFRHPAKRPRCRAQVRVSGCADVPGDQACLSVRDSHILGPGRSPAGALPWRYVSITSVKVKCFKHNCLRRCLFHSIVPSSILPFEGGVFGMAIGLFRSDYRKYKWGIDLFGG